MAKTKPRFRDATEARHAYRRAEAPMIGGMDGDWRVEFLGNKRWLDLLPRIQRILGLHKLFGMRVVGTTATHLLGNPKRNLEEVKPLSIELALSVVDGRATAAMTSLPDNGKLWELFSSEVRVLDSDTLLGVDLVGWQSKVVPMPFLLHRHEA